MPKKLSDRQIARIHMFKALGFSGPEIAEREDVNINTIRKYIRDSKNRVEDGADPEEVFGEQVENLLEVRAIPKRGVSDRASLSVEEVDNE